MFILVFIGIAIFTAIVLCGNNAKGAPSQSNSSAGSKGYPYRPDVEVRLPSGCITTRGYAAVHPEQFAHWQHGPENVYGESIDRTDWENWRVNYYGMD